MTLHQLPGDAVDIGPADARRRPGEIAVDHGVVQADRLEDLGAAVALHGGDAHLGHGLDDPFDGGLDEVLDRLLVVEARQHPLLDHVIQGFEGQVGVDGIDAVAEQHGKVVHLARFARFQHQ